MLVYCDNKECTNFIEVMEPVSEEFYFTCRECAPPSPDMIRFQECQFDPDLRRSSKPQDTEHVYRQGCDTDDVVDPESTLDE